MIFLALIPTTLLFLAFTPVFQSMTERIHGDRRADLPFIFCLSGVGFCGFGIFLSYPPENVTMPVIMAYLMFTQGCILIMIGFIWQVLNRRQLKIGN